MLSESWRQATAWVLVASVLSVLTGGSVLAEPASVFSGKVLDAGSADPRSGVVVRLVGSSPEAAYAAAPTGSDGAFRLEGAPPGSYRVLAETDEGAYLAADGYELASGPNRPVALTLGAASPSYQTTATGTQPSSGLPTWAKWTIVGGITLIALWAIDSVTDDETEAPASPM